MIIRALVHILLQLFTKNRKSFFGHIENDEMVLNEIGKIVRDFWKEIPKHFSNSELDEFIVMPNHVHGIIILDDDKNKRQPIGTIINQFKRACTIEIRVFNIEFG